MVVVRTERNLHHEVFYDIVFEWEDELCKALKTQLFYARNYNFFGRDVSRSLLYRLHINVEDIRLCGKIAFAYEMFGDAHEDLIHSSHTAICVIDFYPQIENLHHFYYTHRKTPYLFVSSREVYDFLMNHHPERKIYHLPLSLPDQYRISANTVFEKKYDLVPVGRQNEKLMDWLHIYSKNHHINYVYRKYADHSNNAFPYYTNDGKFVSNVVTRADYFSLLRKSKIAFYTTPGIEGDPKNTYGFSQVTPRFLELLSCGCLLLGCYPDNADTRYYRLEEYVVNVNSYEQFENAMNSLLKKKVDIEKYSSFLESHYTSAIAKKLIDVIE